MIRAMFRFMILTLFVLSCSVGSSPGGEVSDAVKEIVPAANAFLVSLDKDQLAKSTFTFDHTERENWHYIPKERSGLPIKNMSPEQQEAAFNLVRVTLSAEGLSKTKDIIYLEGYLAEKEGRPDFRDDEKYYFTVFGTPDQKGAWGWRLEGHHLSVNFTFVDGVRVSVTPSFMGANPAEVREGPRKGLRPLGQEEDLARDLASMLIKAGHTEVVFSSKPPKEILSRADVKAVPLEPVGIAVAEMPPEAQTALKNLIATYAERHRSEIAADTIKRINADFSKIHFGWAGNLERGKAFYYRVQGPTFLIETANVQNKANHIHTVWRDFNGDFGRDILSEHLHNHAH